MGTTDQEPSAAARRMKAFIDDNIQEKITAKMLSDVVSYSQYHAARVFKQHTGRTPFEYIRECSSPHWVGGDTLKCVRYASAKYLISTHNQTSLAHHIF